MKQPKIHLPNKNISYKEFVEQFGNHFQDSHEPRRQKAIDTEYERVTGRKAPVKNEITGTKNDSNKVKGNDSRSDAKAITGKSEAE